MENKLVQIGEGARSACWNLDENPANIDPEELLLRNTFVNSKNAPIADIFSNNEIKMQTMMK